MWLKSTDLLRLKFFTDIVDHEKITQIMSFDLISIFDTQIKRLTSDMYQLTHLTITICHLSFILSGRGLLKQTADDYCEPVWYSKILKGTQRVLWDGFT